MKVIYEFDLDRNPELRQEKDDSFNGVSWRATCQELEHYLKFAIKAAKRDEEEEILLRVRNELYGILNSKGLDLYD